MYPIDANCSCYACTNFTRAYIHHLLRVGEVLGSALCTIHNLCWFNHFMSGMRKSILEGTFQAFREEVHRLYPERTAPKPVAGGGGGGKPERRAGRNRKGGGRRKR